MYEDFRYRRKRDHTPLWRGVWQLYQNLFVGDAIPNQFQHRVAAGRGLIKPRLVSAM
jgi:hypothetical protein